VGFDRRNGGGLFPFGHLHLTAIFDSPRGANLASILVLVGLLTLNSRAKINFQNFSESFLIFLVPSMITLT
jgi:xanthine/uracil/vitamin C permease (AzgA family)